MASVLESIGTYSIKAFMQQFWQREACLARQAFPDFKPIVDPDALFKLAANDEVESRLIVREDEHVWSIEHGPFSSRTWKKMPAKDWTVLVQGVNLWLPEADALLRQFAFIPYARLDDLMISYAVEGGGVGPHFDSYDVFLLQAMGQRRWSISAQEDLSLIEDMPLKILANFQSEQSWVLDAGDMLYLPPRYAHDGVAVGECMTYSVGFRSPSHAEWSQGFLNFWHDELAIEGVYRDAGLLPTASPAEIPTDVAHHVVHVIQSMLWKSEDIRRFVGVYLTEPKETVFFEAPTRPISLKRFREDVMKKELRFDLRTQALYDTEAFYCNGEMYSFRDFSAAVRSFLCMMANARAVSPALLQSLDVGDQSMMIEEILYEGYLLGYWQ